jgi:hypothetical protein
MRFVSILLDFKKGVSVRRGILVVVVVRRRRQSQTNLRKQADPILFLIDGLESKEAPLSPQIACWSVEECHSQIVNRFAQKGTNFLCPINLLRWMHQNFDGIRLCISTTTPTTGDLKRGKMGKLLKFEWTCDLMKSFLMYVITKLLQHLLCVR